MKSIKKIIPLLFLLISCNQTSSSVESISSSNESIQSSISQSSSEESITANLIEVMTIYKQLGNYTYTINDEVFDVFSTLRYTINAYYYQASDEDKGGKPQGYAENDIGVFPYVINDDDTVTMGNYLTNSNGEYIKDLWFTTILSFLDIELNALPLEPIEGNKYLIEDAENKVLISGLAGLGDPYLQDYIDVYIELTSNTTFRTIIHTARLEGKYVGYVYGEVSNVGTTEIKPIQTILENGGGPSEVDTLLIDILKKLKEGKNYTLTLSGTNNYVDSFTNKNYYSKNLDDDTLSKGYAGSSDGVFSYQIKNGEIIPYQVIENGSGGVFSSVWNLPGLYSFASLNLSNLLYQKNEDGSYTINDYSTINNFSNITHSGNAGGSDTLTITPSQDSLSFIFTNSKGSINGVVNNISTTSIPEIEEYIASGKGPLVILDIDDAGRNFISSLKTLKNYTLEIKSTFSSNKFTLTKKFTPTAYYQDHSNNDLDYGYIELNDGIYKVLGSENSFTKGDIQNGDFLWASSLFKSLANIDNSSISGKKLSSNEYTLTDSNSKNSLYEIAGFGLYDLMFYVKSVSFKITNIDTYESEFIIDLGNYGKVTIKVKDVNSTVIEGINNL